MTDKEAMKLALDALESDNPDIQLRAAIVLRTALKERLEDPMREVQRLGQEIEQEKALQALHSENERLGLYKDAYAEQEPVAVKRMKEWVEFLKRQSDNGQHMNIPSSFGAGTCWELAIELEQFINTHPPQRTEQSGWRKKQIDDAEEEAWRELEKKNEST